MSFKSFSSSADSANKTKPDQKAPGAVKIDAKPAANAGKPAANSPKP